MRASGPPQNGTLSSVLCFLPTAPIRPRRLSGVPYRSRGGHPRRACAFGVGVGRRVLYQMRGRGGRVADSGEGAPQEARARRRGRPPPTGKATASGHTPSPPPPPPRPQPPLTMPVAGSEDRSSYSMTFLAKQHPLADTLVPPPLRPPCRRAATARRPRGTRTTQFAHAAKSRPPTGWTRSPTRWQPSPHTAPAQRPRTPRRPTAAHWPVRAAADGSAAPMSSDALRRSATRASSPLRPAGRAARAAEEAE